MDKNSYLKMLWFKNYFLNNVDSLNVLDICPESSSTKYNFQFLFDEDGYNYFSLDLKNNDNIDFFVENIYSWHNVHNQSFDVLVSTQFFDFFDFCRIFPEFQRVLTKGGIVCLLIPLKNDDLFHENVEDRYRFHNHALSSILNFFKFNMLHISTNDLDFKRKERELCLIFQKMK